MSEHANLLLLRQVYAFTPGVFDARIGPEFVCHTPGRSQVAGDFAGAEGMDRHQRQMASLSGGSMSLEQYHWYADDVWGSVHSRLRGSRNGMSMDIAVNGVWRFTGDRIAEHWELIEDLVAWDRFWT